MMIKTIKQKKTFLHALKILLDQTKIYPELTIQQILEVLSGKGYAALLIVLSFPFCFPIQIPGFSTPFGLLLAFLGLRIAFAKKPWWPQWILNKKIKSEFIAKLVQKTIKLVLYMHKFVHPRLLFLTESPFFHRLNGILVFILAIFLALPLPIPMTNLLTALPLLCMGLGLMEEDGLFILLSYILGFIGISFFISLFIFGYSHLQNYLYP
ncbi:MAG: exopolysaccharide biosynthesis protein [Chlamydiales bacterium]|nr:exopolysaccharide biosynthesis protein [Chlamydiales bacterium]